MGKYFGTDGFRGEANVNLTVEHAYKVGRFLGWYYGQRAKKTADNPEGRCRVAIGKDTRRSSYMFEYSLVAGLTASGADVYLLHVTTTPSLGLLASLTGEHGDPAKCKSLTSLRLNLDRHLIGSTTDTFCLNLQNRHDVVHSLFEDFQSRLAALLFYTVKCTVYDFLCNTLLTIKHDIVDQLGYNLVVV